MKKYKRTKTDHFKKLGFGGLLRRGHVQKKAVFPIYCTKTIIGPIVSRKMGKKFLKTLFLGPFSYIYGRKRIKLVNFNTSFLGKRVRFFSSVKNSYTFIT